MKYIHVDVNVAKAKWLTKAEDAAKIAAAKPDDQTRQEYITSKSAIWSELKPELDKLSDGKCWYTEARDKVSYWEVDHYRPKKLYPWLAFEWRNFRLCGGKPNRKKTDEFNLKDNATRATIAAPDTGPEQPLLLDPTRMGDVDLLTFKPDGEPTCAAPKDELAVSRVTDTVAAIELDSELLCSARREVWRKAEHKLKSLRDLVEAERHKENGDAASFSIELCKDIAELSDDKAEFTSTVKACVTQLQAENILVLARRLAAKNA